MSEITIGFCTGAWDLFHEGHQNAINFCKERCDFLIVGVCSDDYIKDEKGGDRPVDNYAKRWINVMKGGAGRAVPLYEKDDEERIESFLDIADVWFIGENQFSRDVDFTIKRIIIPRTPGISTTQLINKEV